jgi:hypothetical protein
MTVTHGHGLASCLLVPAASLHRSVKLAKLNLNLATTASLARVVPVSPPARAATRLTHWQIIECNRATARW